MDLSSIAKGLKHHNGVWFSNEKHSISYPESGNAECFQIEENSFWFAHRNRCIVELVKRFSPDDYLFDIGGGNGFTALALEQAGIRTVLVEPGGQGIENAKKRGLKNLVCSTLEDAAFESKSLRAAGLFDVVEHISDDYAFIKNLNNLLDNNGKIYITVPAYNFLWSKEDTMGGHYRRYTLRRLSKLLENSGFDILYKTYIFSFLPIPIFLLRSIPSKLGLSRNTEIKKYKKQHKEVKLFRSFLDWEVQQIKNQRPIYFGGSCLIVASKRTP